MSLNTHGLERAGHIIYYDWKIGGFTVDEWLVYWTWQYLISSIPLEEYLAKIDYIQLDMPGSLDSARWDAHTKYLLCLES